MEGSGLRTSVLYAGLLLFALSSIVSSQFSPPKFIVGEIGSSINLTCPKADPTKNYTYKFSSSQKPLITPGGRFKQYGNILMIVGLEWADSAAYSCSLYDSNGNKISTKTIGILTLKRARKYYFRILPEQQTSIVHEGRSIEFRCEYEKGSTVMKWFRRRDINGTKVDDYIPRHLLTVRTDSSKSIEVYFIKKVSVQDSGTYKCEVIEKNGNLRSTQALVLQVRKSPVFTSPPVGAILYKREYTTIEIPWKFINYAKRFGAVAWFYKKAGSSDPGRGALIYVVDSKGIVVPRLAETNQFDDRIEFKGNLSNQDATLAIKDFMKRDEGDFTCEVRGGWTFHRLVTIKATVSTKQPVLQKHTCTAPSGKIYSIGSVFSDKNCTSQCYCQNGGVILCPRALCLKVVPDTGCTNPKTIQLPTGLPDAQGNSCSCPFVTCSTMLL